MYTIQHKQHNKHSNYKSKICMRKQFLSKSVTMKFAKGAIVTAMVVIVSYFLIMRCKSSAKNFNAIFIFGGNNKPENKKTLFT